MKRSIAVVAMLVVGFAATTCAQTGREIAQKVKTVPTAIPVGLKWL